MDTQRTDLWLWEDWDVHEFFDAQHKGAHVILYQGAEVCWTVPEQERGGGQAVNIGGFVPGLAAYRDFSGRRLKVSFETVRERLCPYLDELRRAHTQ